MPALSNLLLRDLIYCPLACRRDYSYCPHRLASELQPRLLFAKAPARWAQAPHRPRALIPQPIISTLLLYVLNRCCRQLVSQRDRTRSSASERRLRPSVRIRSGEICSREDPRSSRPKVFWLQCINNPMFSNFWCIRNWIVVTKGVYPFHSTSLS